MSIKNSFPIAGLYKLTSKMIVCASPPTQIMKIINPLYIRENFNIKN